ncbi:hypothetical protein BMF94_0592 [Rhodotorula taiwanensis]|uniref:4-nitrophenylphosphatase n=1 Tax=Rhodotorula taiwanensis TaxID=741276 RepID=A0A2S5BI14_9BASI|nr:hypothetical protein BMF94_0592 [Rhodotorula taiwanensis]
MVQANTTQDIRLDGHADELEIRDKKDVQALLDRYDAFLFDCDGVIWHLDDREKMTPDAAETINFLKDTGKKVNFVTNNGSKSRGEYLEKFRKHGFNVELEEIHTSGSATAGYVRDVVLPDISDKSKRKVYVIGSDSFEKELQANGLEWTGGTDPEDKEELPPFDYSCIKADPAVGVVVFQFHTQITYKQLTKGFNYLASNEGCRLICTNDNETMLIENGGSAPGAGALLKVLLAALPEDKQPVIVSKPWQEYMDQIRRRTDFDRRRTVFVGDRVQTDVLFANRGGLDSLLVFSGRTQPDDLHHLTAEQAPNYTMSHIGVLQEGKET